ncbi:MAG: protein phosphatase 2C domain-containing protein [Acidobacteriota bacterium]
MSQKYTGEDIFTTVAAITDPGVARANNEDSYLVAFSHTGQVLPPQARFNCPAENLRLIAIVSDGMGGAEGGEIASSLTVETIRATLPRLAPRLSPQSRLEAAIEEANCLVWQHRNSDPRLHLMGATVTAALIECRTAHIAEIGDSRAYVLREGRIKQLTKDQTFVQALIDAGALSDEQAATHQRRNVILQAVGSQEYLQVAVTSIDLRAGDILLLCSDGLSTKINPNEIYTIVANSQSLLMAANNLVAFAKQRGGEDNITVILIHFTGNGLPESLESLTTTIQIHSSFDPDQEAKPRRKIRPATFEDWEASAIVDHFAVTDAQREALRHFSQFGEHITFPQEDYLVKQGESGEDVNYHYWLLSGRYRVELDLTGRKQTVALLVPPTDLRSDEEITCGFGPLRVKRQFFTASQAMLTGGERNATIWCEDRLNCAIKIHRDLFYQIAQILGERFLSSVRYS